MSGYHHEHPTPEPLGPPPNIPEAPTVASMRERLAVVEANFGQMWLAAVYAVHCAESPEEGIEAIRAAMDAIDGGAEG